MTRGTPQGPSQSGARIGDTWQGTSSRARALPELLLLERVDDEWSFVETLRHLVPATDCWVLVAERSRQLGHRPRREPDGG